MNTLRPVRIDHIKDYLNRDINVLPFLFKKYHGSSEEQISTMLQTMSESHVKILENCVRSYVEIKLAKQDIPEIKEKPKANIKTPRMLSGEDISMRGTDFYWRDLFTAEALNHRADYSDYVWSIRDKWADELGRLMHNGGCTSCQRNALMRKYIGILTQNALTAPIPAADKHVSPYLIPTARTGNILFFIATAYAYAKANNLQLCIPWDANEEIRALQPLLAASKIQATPSGKNEPIVFSYTTQAHTYNAIPKELPSGSIRGHFQNERYFSDYKEDIRKLYKNLTSEQQEGTLGIHIRLTDYRSHVTKPFLDYRTYIGKALKKIPMDKVKNLIIFSDEPITALNMVKTLDIPKSIKIEVDGNDTLSALRRMTGMQYLITSASSYSWWGAWLGDHDIVTVPTPWLHDPTIDYEGVYCEGWIRI